jgi:hypothetical protein
MKHRRYNRFMKLHKKLILVAATVLVVGGAGTGVALAMQNEPKKVVGQSAAVVPQNEPVEAVTEQETATETVMQDEVPVEPVETIQEEAERRTREHASKFELDPGMQWMRMNAFISKGIGYSDPDRVRTLLNNRLQERRNEQGGYIVVYWDGVGSSKTKIVYL